MSYDCSVVQRPLFQVLVKELDVTKYQYNLLRMLFSPNVCKILVRLLVDLHITGRYLSKST